MPSRVVKVAFRRLLAFGIDWCVLAAYAGLLFLFVTPFVSPLFKQSPYLAELTGFFLLTLPMTLYFSVMEASSWSGTLGKRLLRLRVIPRGGKRKVSYLRSLLRSSLKLLPWELAHFAVWNVFVFEDSAAGGIGIVALVLAYGLIFTYWVSLFVRDGRTPYDHFAGVIVQLAQ